MPGKHHLLQERFVRLCEIPSPTGSERRIADHITAELRDLGCEVREDGSAGPARAGAGNLWSWIPGRLEQSVLLCAHMDTVPHDGEVRVRLGADGVYRSAGETILGADNKAAIAVLVELAARSVQRPPPLGIELVLTVAEEDGLRGARRIEAGALRSAMGFVFDHASPIGELVVAAPTYHRLAATFKGQEAHAGLCPEAGRSAIRAASRAVSSMELGRLDSEATANVGIVAGGTAPNVVPGRCRIEGESRAIEDARAGEVCTAMIDACNWAAGEESCNVDIEVSTPFRGYRLRHTEPCVQIASAALGRLGYEPSQVVSGAGSDANALNAAGIPCVNVANGTRDSHTPEESVSATSLDAMLAAMEAILEEAASRC